MKRNKRLLEIPPDETDRPDQDELRFGGDSIPGTFVAHGADLRQALSWYAAVAGGGILPRDFEMTVVPGPEEPQ